MRTVEVALDTPSKISPNDKAHFSNLIFVIFQSPPTTEEKWPNARNRPPC